MIGLRLWSNVKLTVNAYLIAIAAYPGAPLSILSLSTVVTEVRSDHVRNVSNWIGREPKLLEFGYHTRYLVQGGTDIIPNHIVKTIDTT